MTDSMIYIWLGVTVLCIVMEAASVQLTSIWFALGAVVAFILAMCGVKSIAVQITVFAAVSLISLIETRPFVKKVLQKRVSATNADRNIGDTGITLTEINNIDGKGEVKVKGIVWTARSEDGSVIPEGQMVRIERIEGVKVIVKAI